MTDKARIKIAAAVTALFLAGISAAGVAAHDHQSQPAATIATPSANAAAAARGDDEGYVAGGSEEIEDDE